MAVGLGGRGRRLTPRKPLATKEELNVSFADLSSVQSLMEKTNLKHRTGQRPKKAASASEWDSSA